jgi:hypothetical protein
MAACKPSVPLGIAHCDFDQQKSRRGDAIMAKNSNGSEPLITIARAI